MKTHSRHCSLIIDIFYHLIRHSIQFEKMSTMLILNKLHDWSWQNHQELSFQWKSCRMDEQKKIPFSFSTWWRQEKEKKFYLISSFVILLLAWYYLKLSQLEENCLFNIYTNLMKIQIYVSNLYPVLMTVAVFSCSSSIRFSKCRARRSEKQTTTRIFLPILDTKISHSAQNKRKLFFSRMRKINGIFLQHFFSFTRSFAHVITILCNDSVSKKIFSTEVLKIQAWKRLEVVGCCTRGGRRVNVNVNIKRSFFTFLHYIIR